MSNLTTRFTKVSYLVLGVLLSVTLASQASAWGCSYQTIQTYENCTAALFYDGVLTTAEDNSCKTMAANFKKICEKSNAPTPVMCGMTYSFVVDGADGDVLPPNDPWRQNTLNFCVDQNYPNNDNNDPFMTGANRDTFLSYDELCDVTITLSILSCS